MANGINKVILIGNLGADPEVRFTANGTAVTNLSIATNESWRDKQTGEQQEKTEWHRIVLFGRNAETAGEYLSKGRSVYIEGKLQTRKWQDQSGQDRYSTEVLALTMQMLGGGGSSGTGESSPASPKAGVNADAAKPAPAAAPEPAPAGGGGGDFWGDDIPFAMVPGI